MVIDLKLNKETGVFEPVYSLAEELKRFPPRWYKGECQSEYVKRLRAEGFDPKQF